MKLIIGFLIVLALYGSAQPQTWVRIYKDGPYEQHPYDMAIDNAGNIVVTGYAVVDTFNYQYAIVKYNPAGNMLWDVTYGKPRPAEELPSKVITDSQGNIYVTGLTRTGSGPMIIHNVLTAKFNSSGAFQWAAEYDTGPDSEDKGTEIQLDASGSVYVTVQSRAGDSRWGRVIKYNPAGVQQWMLTLDSALGSIIVEPSGSFYFSYSKRAKLYIAKYNSSGVFQWVTPYTGSQLSSMPTQRDFNNNLYGVGQGTVKLFKFDSTGTFQWGDSSISSPNQYRALGLDPWGNIYVTGNSGNKILVRKFNPAGQILWTTYYDEPDGGGETGDLISIDNLGNCYVVGHYTPESMDGNIVTLKLDSSGVIRWTDTYGGASGDYDRACRIIAKNPDEIYVSLGSANTGYGPDFATLKYGTGLVQIITEGNAVPSTFTFYQNYPNPFNPETNIRFDLPQPSNVKIVIYNSLGRQMQVLVNEHKPAGSYEVKFNAEGYAGGVYFYTITTGEFTETRKMVIVK